MESDAHRALVLYWLDDVWNTQNLDAIDHIFSPNYRVNGRPVPPEAVKQAVAYLHKAFAPARAVVEDTVSQDNKTAVRWSIYGTHSGQFMDIAPTGKPVHLIGINIYQIENNQFVANDGK